MTIQNMIFKHRITGSIFFLAVLSTVCFAQPKQNSPTFNETTGWLAKKLHIYQTPGPVIYVREISGSSDFVRTKPAIQNSVMVISELYNSRFFTGDKFVGARVEATISIPLDKLDPHYVLSEGNTFVLNTLDKEAAIEAVTKIVPVTGDFSEINRKENWAIIRIQVESETMAKRIAEAFRHAIRLAIVSAHKPVEPF